jgi:AmmeMemoRadiSam system protein A
MSRLADEEGTALLEIARESLAEALGVAPAPARDESWLFAPGATFVTLTQAGRLRGCVGTVAAHRPLIEDVRHNARSAALEDSRFSPLTAAELPLIRIEVSLLSPLEPLDYGSEQQAAASLQPGRDGVLLEYGICRATFLPQVWQQIPSPEDFLRDLKRKAGLSSDFWDPSIRLWHYTVTKWSE